MNWFVSRKRPFASPPPPIASTLMARDPVPRRSAGVNRGPTADVDAVCYLSDLVHKFGLPSDLLAYDILSIGYVDGSRA